MSFADREAVEHHLRAQPARRDRDRGRPMRFEFMALGEGQPVHCDLGQIVEHRDPVLGRVELGSAVGHLDQQATRPIDQQRQQVVRRDQVRVDRQP